MIMIALAGCGGEEATDRDLVDTAASANEAPATGEYTVVEVRDGGTISGRVTLEGKVPALDDFEITADQSVCAPASRNNRLVIGPDNGLAHAVVYIDGIREGKPMPVASSGDLTIDQRGCQYTPHVVAAPLGSTVVFTNSDQAPHNVRVENPANDSVLMNVAQPMQGKRDEMVVRHAGPLSVGCDYHPWMNAYIFGVDNPYYAVTDTSGAFTIANVPPGTYTVKMWFNGIDTSPRKDNQGRIIRYSFGEHYLLEKKVEVKPRAESTIAFAVSPAGMQNSK